MTQRTIFECTEGRAYRTDSGRIGVSCNSEFPPAMAVEIERLQTQAVRLQAIEAAAREYLAANRRVAVAALFDSSTLEALQRDKAVAETTLRTLLGS